MEWILIALLNIVVGGLIGVSGIAGFLLPMAYAGYFGMPVHMSLALSFLAFLVSGSIGSWNYHRKGNLDIRFSMIIGCGSFIGALIGVRLNLFIPAQTVKLILYVVVLLSGISILLRKDKQGTGQEPGQKRKPLDNKALVIGIGIITGAICSLSGAGGPVLVMPLLVALGMNIRTAIGVALFDSLFIGLPAFIGYLGQCDVKEMGAMLIFSAALHGIGVLLGSTNAHRISQRPLKMSVAVFSIGIACYMIAVNI